MEKTNTKTNSVAVKFQKCMLDLRESVEKKEYDRIINEMITSKSGTVLGYLRDFLIKKSPNEWWSQPEFMAYANKHVVEDGGVGWWNKSHGGKGYGKHNPDGSLANFGDGGRAIEIFRQETFEGCFDNKTGKDAGPFRLNIENYNNYKGSTKSHSFSNNIKKAVTKRAKGICELCGHKGKTEIDHFIPKQKGGQSILENANALCRRCNDRKCAKEPADFMNEEITRLYKYFKYHKMGKDFIEFTTKLE